jgi:hypothetical protein
MFRFDKTMPVDECRGVLGAKVTAPKYDKPEQDEVDGGRDGSKLGVARETANAGCR